MRRDGEVGMSDREKVINDLQSKVEELEEQLAIVLEGQQEKEQEAVEPIPFFTETGEESQNYVICGHCKSIKAIMPKYTKQKYCHECGFPVLWEVR